VRGIHQIPGEWADQVRKGANAGIDMFMEPNAYQDFETTLLDEVRAGRVKMARINDAVRRILQTKFELGLFEHPYTDRTHIDEIGSAAHRAVARQAAAESQVLLKNDGDALPLSKDASLYVAGRNANDMGNQTGGWTIRRRTPKASATSADPSGPSTWSGWPDIRARRSRSTPGRRVSTARDTALSRRDCASSPVPWTRRAISTQQGGGARPLDTDPV